jgi:hypothetical protein
MRNLFVTVLLLAFVPPVVAGDFYKSNGSRAGRVTSGRVYRSNGQRAGTIQQGRVTAGNGRSVGRSTNQTVPTRARSTATARFTNPTARMEAGSTAARCTMPRANTRVGLESKS